MSFPFQPGDKLNASDLNVAIKQSYQNFTADEDIGARVPVIINSSGDIKKGTIDQIENFLGFTMEAVSSGTVTPSGVQVSGIVDGLSGLTVGQYYTLNNTPGNLIKSTKTDAIGLAIDIDKLLMIPRYKKSLLGDGSNGDVTISADTTLTRDMYYNNLTINTGCTLYTAGYRIFVRGTISGSGVIDNSGGNGGNGGSGVLGSNTGGSGGAGGAGTPTGTLAGSPAGKAGGAGSANSPVNGENGTSENPSIGVSGSGGGSGGSGGSSGGGSGGSGGSSTFENLEQTIREMLYQSDSGTEKDSITFLHYSGVQSGKKLSPSSGSGGGGGGGGDTNTPNAGGGGGGAGGTGGNIEIIADTISGTFTIQAKGGNGGNGGDAVTNSGGGGGGAGGAGGNVCLIYRDISGYTGTIDVSGGAGGAGGGTGGSSSAQVGIAGSNGNTGHIFKIKLIE